MKNKNNFDSLTKGFDDEVEGESLISLKDFFEKVRILWPWVILSILICTSIAFLYLAYASPKYKIHATLLVQDEKKGSSLMAAASALQDLSGIGGKSNVDNEALVIKSRTPMEKTVRQLQLYVLYFNNNKIKKKEIYIDRPIDLNFSSLPKVPSSPHKPYQVEIDKATNSFVISDAQKNYKGRLGDSVALKEGKAMVTAGPGFTDWPSNEPFYVGIQNFDATVENYMDLLSVDIANKQASVIDLTLIDGSPEKGQMILNELINQYLKANLEDKNRIADSTVKFIDERLALVSDELTGIEKNIENFKTTNKIADISEQSKLLLKNTSDNVQKGTELQVQLSVIKDLESFLQNNINDRKTVPSSLIMDDPNFVSLIKAYNELQLARDKRLMSQTPENPAVQTMDEQLRNLRQSLLSSIGSIKRGVQTSISQLGKYTAGFESQISTIPAKERQFLDFSRQQAIKQELYVFLLTKREETAVSKASNIAITQIVDTAKSESKPFKPIRLLVILGGIVIGAILPFGFSYGRQMLNDKVTSISDIEKATKAPILAEIAHNTTTETFAVTRNSRTQIAERFRAMRTHLNYLLPSEADKTILFTSCMGGEGKSFLSINLAQTLALANKKVLLMEMDLRKPKIREYLGLKKIGFSNFIVGKDNNWQQYIQKSGENNNIDVFCSGPVPPNPTELLLLPKMRGLMQQLQKEYEYIIIDTAPVGLVTDAEILATYANLTLYVVRHNYSLKPRLQILDNLYRKNLLPKLNVLVNDVKYTSRAYGGYGYGYYGSDGYTSENVEEIISK